MCGGAPERSGAIRLLHRRIGQRVGVVVDATTITIPLLTIIIIITNIMIYYVVVIVGWMHSKWSDYRFGSSLSRCFHAIFSVATVDVESFVFDFTTIVPIYYW
jgi:hypothetical protein